MVNGVIYPEVEPRNEIEKELAMIYCRINCWTLPISGRVMTREEAEILRSAGGRITHGISELIDPGVLQFVWMHPEIVPWRTPRESSTEQREPK